MKGLDILIIILVILVLASGSFLGYLVYTNYLADNEQANPDNNATPTQAKALCVDMDEDGYGENCPLGPDCDDKDDERNKECKILEGEMSLTGESTKYSVGDEIVLDVMINYSKVEDKLDTLNLRIDYDSELLEFEDFQVNQEIAEEFVLDLKQEDRIAYEVIPLTDGEGLQDGDKIATIVFKAQKEGMANIQMAEDTRLSRIYELPDEGLGSVDIPIEE